MKMRWSLRKPTSSASLVALASIAMVACAVGTTGDGAPFSTHDARPDAPSASAKSDADVVVDTGVIDTDAGTPGRDASTSNADSGGAKDGSTKADASPAACAPPSKPAACNGGCTAHICAPNGCYGGYLCDPATTKCKAPGACP